MSVKSTDELINELTGSTSVSYYLSINHTELMKTPLTDHLSALLQEKNVKSIDVIRAAGLDRTYGYQIFSGAKNPSRDKLIAIALGFQLSLYEAQKLLKISKNAPLYVRDERDVYIIFAIKNRQSVFDLNMTLLDSGLPLIHN